MSVDENCFQPLVSAVVTTYNRPEMAKRAIESVIKQTYDPMEIIVVEDASETDLGTWTQTNHPQIHYIRHDQNKGLAAARNTGLELANGDYVAYLDDDDEWKPERIERQVERLAALPKSRREKVGVIYCGTERRTPDEKTENIGIPENSGNLRESIQKVGASTLSSSFLFSKGALQDVSGFDESLKSSIDHDIWMSLAVEGYHVIPLADPLVIIRPSPDENMMSNTISRIKGVEQYLVKWTPIYKEWFGPEEGKRYRDQYFARVIGRLVTANIIDGDISEAGVAVSKILTHSDEYWYNSKIISYALLRGLVIGYAPPTLEKMLKRLKNTVLE